MLNKKSSFKKMLVTIGLLSVFSNSYADVTIAEYKAAKKNPEKMAVAKMQLHNMFEGISYASLDLGNQGQKQIFCPPSKLVINSDNLVTMLDKKIAVFDNVMKDKGGVPPQFPVASILLMALKSNFPCQ